MPADTDMRERLERVETKVDQLQRVLIDEIRVQFAGMGAQLEERLEQRLGERLDRRLDTRMQDLEARLDRRFQGQIEDMGRRFQVQTEALRELLMAFADGFGGVLDGVQREVRDFRAEFRTKVDATDNVLANHAQRIVVLERATGVSPN